MLEYMDYIVRSFESCTGWNRDNSYENITATSQNILDFPIPTALKFQISNKSTPYTFTTFELSNNKVINGSLSYLYTNCDGLEDAVKNSKQILLQNGVDNYRYIQPFYHHQKKSQTPFTSKSLYYGKMYYPGSTLEAMVMKRLSSYTQFIIKCVSSPSLINNGCMTFYWQRDTGQNFQEWIFSTNEILAGYRLLHNFVGSQSKLSTSLYNNSSLSVGGELWFSVLNLSPGFSTTLRYCTHSTNTGKPLTLSLSWNPLYGHVSSTYSVKTSTGTTFCSKYDFNLYSIDSNLSFGCEFWRRGKLSEDGNTRQQSQPEVFYVPDFQLPKTEDLQLTDMANSKPDNPMYYHLMAPKASQQLLQDLNLTFSSSLRKITREKSVIETFENSVTNTNFTSVWKLATSLRDKNLRVLWEGKYKGFLISAGTELTTAPLDLPASVSEKSETAKPSMLLRPAKFGIQIQYST